MINLSDIHTLQIEPTTFCNAKCPHCARFDEYGNLHPDLKLGHLDIDAITDNLELSRMHNLQLVILEGDKGDPIMHPKIEKIIDTFASAPSAPQIKLTTNGSIRSVSWWQNLAKKNYKNLEILFSIDGLRDTNHLYRVGLDYDTIINNARAFISAGGDATWKFILFKHNEHQLNQVLELSKELGFEQFEYVTCRDGEFRGLDQWPVFINGQISHYLERPLNQKFGKIFHVRKNEKIEQIIKLEQMIKIKPEKICPNLAEGLIYINNLSQVVPCCMMHFDTQLKYFGTKRLNEMTGGFEQQDLSLYPLSEILNHKFFNHVLYDSLVQGKWHFNCARSCKATIIENLKHVQS